MRILAAALVALAIPTLAFAETGAQFTDAQYLRASRCAAYNETPALQGEATGAAWLASALKADAISRQEFLTTKASDEARDIARLGRKANTEEKIAALRAERDKACAGFIAPTTSAAAASNPGG